MTERNVRCIPLETFAEPFSKLVGKKSGDGESWLPLFAHLLDTAGVMKHLYQRWLPKNIINTIFQENPDIDSEILEKVCVFCALSHDIGKGTPVFQAMICNNTSSSIKDRFADIGLSLMDFSGFIDRCGVFPCI